MDDEHIVSIHDEIELHSRKVVRSIEAGEGSSGAGQHRPATAMEVKIEMLKRAGAQPGAVQASKIQKVIFLLRDHKCFVKYFEPKVASIGPIHHGNPKYELGERYKLRLAYEFVKGFSCNINGNTLDDDIISNLYGKIKKEIKQLRGCFEEEVTKNYDDEALAWILFVDGCAILQYIFCAAPPTLTASNKFSELNIKNDSVAFAQQDLFLLENQVPYRLLKLLMRYSGKEAELNESIERFIGSVTYQQTKPQQKQRDPTHLLDLLRTRLLGPPPGRKAEPSSSRCPFTHQEDPDWQTYRNVQELKAAGIHLKRSKNDSYLGNISFTRRFGFGFYPGYLWLPPITVDDSTGPKFMNLIAYEMCLDFENDFGISSYLSFLDSLIDEANDVKYMRKARVLHNFLGSDQEVADLFNAIGTDLVPNPEAYKDVKIQIQKYYDTHWMTYMAQFRHDHFSSPWTIIAFLGVLLVLALTAVQAWFAVFPHSSDNGKK
ncbi:hypothetical protein FH972_016716 [Carpinus fangiana]|uniref:Uncharacterized protein n=1 Tax=Carpinus fangiana TaxID=176857 RepID=A0A5N6RGR2_9ROSI|nr:hypothetical protein FH972_016716 [Carpinus fangiana]